MEIVSTRFRASAQNIRCVSIDRQSDWKVVRLDIPEFFHRDLELFDARSVHAYSELATKMWSASDASSLAAARVQHLVANGAAQFCGKHKKPHHVDVINKRCEHPDCLKQPSFGNNQTRVVRWCADHKYLGDVNIINKRCYKPGCIVRPHYGGSDNQPIWCKKHKVSPYCVAYCVSSCWVCGRGDSNMIARDTRRGH
eukprot:SAG11_NODE_3106_length_2685_cov_1.434648_2_plen_197_part_00